MWSSTVYPWPELEERLESCRGRFALDVVRHGQTEANAARRFSGAGDVELTELGHHQAHEMGSRLSGRYDMAFHSSLSRSRLTLELALGSSDATAECVIEDGRLSERSLGVLEGRQTRPIAEYEQGDFSYAPEGGEPYTSVAQRVLSFLADLADLADAAAGRSQPLRALACTHVGPMRILVPVLKQSGEPPHVLTARYPNAEVFSFEVSKLKIPPFLGSALLQAGADGYEPSATA